MPGPLPSGQDAITKPCRASIGALPSVSNRSCARRTSSDCFCAPGSSIQLQVASHRKECPRFSRHVCKPSERGSATEMRLPVEKRSLWLPNQSGLLRRGRRDLIDMEAYGGLRRTADMSRSRQRDPNTCRTRGTRSCRDPALLKGSSGRNVNERNESLSPRLHGRIHRPRRRLRLSKHRARRVLRDPTHSPFRRHRRRRHKRSRCTPDRPRPKGGTGAARAGGKPARRRDDARSWAGLESPSRRSHPARVERGCRRRARHERHQASRSHQGSRPRRHDLRRRLYLCRECPGGGEGRQGVHRAPEERAREDPLRRHGPGRHHPSVGRALLACAPAPR